MSWSMPLPDSPPSGCFTRHMKWEADRFVFPYINLSVVLNVHPTIPDLLCSIIGKFARLQTGNINTEKFHDEFFTNCCPNDPELRSTHQVVTNYAHDWWKDRFDTLGFPLPVTYFLTLIYLVFDPSLLVDSLIIISLRGASPLDQTFEPLVKDILCKGQFSFEPSTRDPSKFITLPFIDVSKVMEMTHEHFDQPALRARVQHLGNVLACMLDEKIKLAAEAAISMANLKGPMDQLEEALMNSSRYSITKCKSISIDFVQQLFDHNVAGDQQSILPPLEIDVPTMLACQQLARVLADAYANPKRVLEKPLIILDSAGRIILWYLPGAISPWIQAEMVESTIGMGSLLRQSMSSGPDTQWRTFPRNFHTSDREQLIPGCINLAPCWFQQGQE
ncbi:hypothetical protein EDD22DRAFT_854601, partial [Suillus occidentalis]